MPTAALRLDAYPGRRYLPEFDERFLGAASDRDLVAAVHPVDPDSVIVAADGLSLMRLWLQGWVAPGETVAIFEPTLPEIRHSILATGAYYVDCGRDAAWGERLDHLALVLKGSVRGIVLADPNFPVGGATDYENWSRVLGRPLLARILVDRRLATVVFGPLWERGLGGWTLLRCPGRASTPDIFALTGPRHEVEMVARLRGVTHEVRNAVYALDGTDENGSRVEDWQRRTQKRLLKMGYRVFVGTGPWLFVYADGVESDKLATHLGHLGLVVEVPEGHIYRHGVVVWNNPASADRAP